MSWSGSGEEEDARIISRRRITHMEEIGQGAFGMVYKASLRSGWHNSGPSQPVVVKILKNYSADNVWAEADRMWNLDHPNVLQLIGVSTAQGDIPWIISEYMMYSDLHSYIRSYNDIHGRNIDAFAMIKYAHGIACGMKYLHHEASTVQVHGDLAARNCLVGLNWDIKIGDFGKFVGDYDICYYDGGNGGGLCPIRWMPPENLPQHYNQPRFNCKGDIWAYGVVLFEIWSGGRLPFEDLSDTEVLNAVRQRKTPDHCYDIKARDYILDIMKNCWEYDPSHRRDFEDIKNCLEDDDNGWHIIGDNSTLPPPEI